LSQVKLVRIAEKQNYYPVFVVAVVKCLIFTRAIATHVFTKDTEVGLIKIRIGLPNTEKKILGLYLKDALVEGLRQSNWWTGMRGKRAVALFAEQKYL